MMRLVVTSTRTSGMTTLARDERRERAKLVEREMRAAEHDEIERAPLGRIRAGGACRAVGPA